MQLNLSLVERKDFHRKKSFYSSTARRNAMREHKKRNLIFPRILFIMFSPRVASEMRKILKEFAK